MENLLKNLHLNDAKSSSEQAHTPTPPPSAAIPVATHTPKKEGGNLFDKIGEFSDSISGHKTPTPAPPPATVAHPQAQTQGVHTPGGHTAIFDKIGSVLGGQHPTPPPATVAQPAPPLEHHKSDIFDKIGDAIQGKKTPPPPPPPQPQQHKSEHIFEKIGDAISGKHTPPPPPPQPVHENLFDKIGGALGGKHTPPPPPKEENIFDQLGNKVFGVGKVDPATKPHGLGDRLNSALGGGHKGEMDEGKLDKTIDLFQEHVLKQGPQNNESAIEQAKDEQIANAIKKATGIGKHGKE